MATIDSIVKYVMNSPYNTNPGVLRSQLSELEGGGGGDLPREVTSAIENDGLGYMDETPAPIIWDGDTTGEDVYAYGEYQFVKRVGDYVSSEAAIGAGVKAHWGGVLISQTFSTEDVQVLYTQDEYNILFFNVLRNTTFNEQPLVKGLYVFDGPEYFGTEGSDVDNIIINGTKITYTLDKATYYDAGYGAYYYLTSADIGEVLDTDEVAVDVNYMGTEGLSQGDFVEYTTLSPVKSTSGTVIGWAYDFMDVPQVFSISQGDGEYNIPAGTYLVCIPAIDTYVSELDLVAQPHLIDRKFLPTDYMVVNLYSPTQGTGRAITWEADKTWDEILEAAAAGKIIYVAIAFKNMLCQLYQISESGAYGSSNLVPNGDKLEFLYLSPWVNDGVVTWDSLLYTITPDSVV